MNSARAVFVFVIIVQSCRLTLSNVWTSEITLAQGKLRGKLDVYNRYKSYLGIPYASVISRFLEAGSSPKWSGTLFADKGSIKCNQYFESSLTGQEDCLVVNIFTPINENNNMLPVMVYIPGGGYDIGGNSDLILNPKYFVQKDVIVVTINYRIGAFGFLCLPGTEVTGNMGLKDIIVAFQWIKKNIQAFGGNANTITVFGQSAGATSIHYMIASGKYKGLFDKAILQSGSILMPNKFEPNPIKTASRVASKMGFKTKDPKELLKIFRNATADDIIEASHVDGKNQPLKLFIFRPCEEKPVIENKPFITATPTELVESSILDPNLDIIMGYNNKEGIKQAGQYDSNGLKDLNSSLSDLIPENIKFTDEREKEALTQDIQNFYFPKGIDYDSLIDFFSDTVMIYPSIATTKSLLSSNIKVYNYYFKYDSCRNLYKFISGLPQKPGASHTDDLCYMFNPVIFNGEPVPPPKQKDLRMINTLTTLWTAFAKTRKPSSLRTSDWIQSKKDSLNFLQIDKEFKMIPLPNKERFQFWDRVYKQYSWI